VPTVPSRARLQQMRKLYAAPASQEVSWYAQAVGIADGHSKISCAARSGCVRGAEGSARELL
jgi:hypothetical protein